MGYGLWAVGYSDEVVDTGWELITREEQPIANSQ
jgi:hypothetical protein